MKRTDPGLGPGPLPLDGFIVPVVQFRTEVLPVVELAHEFSLRFLSAASQPSYAVSAIGIAVRYHRVQSPALFPRHQQHRLRPRVEHEQHPDRDVPARPRPKLLEVTDARSLQRVDQRPTKAWPDLSEHVDGDVHRTVDVWVGLP